MNKEQPAKVVDKPAGKKVSAKKSALRTTTAKARAPQKRTSNKRRSTVRNTQTHSDKQQYVMPEWMKSTLTYISMGVFGVLFILTFYYFFIRPYSYRWKPCYGMQGYGVCLPYGYKVHGLDISHHQGEVNWNQLSRVKNTNFPIKFVFLKASEGGDFKDKSFETNFEQASKYGFIRGAYHFYNPKTDPVQQAQFFISTVKLKPGDLPPVLDIEKKSRDMEKLRTDIHKWLTIVERHYKVKPILYTSYKYKRKYLNDSIFNSYPYWIAHYYVDSVRYEGKWLFWQHTDMGLLPGIDESVDLNVFKGTFQDLLDMTIKE